jgi:hypothetical protein
MSEGKILITGTGRAGTTLLVAILTDLGMDTTFRPGVKIKRVGAGLERDVEDPGAGRVVKAPAYSLRLRGILERGAVQIDHVIIPVRDLDLATASRLRVSRYGRNPGVAGGMWNTWNPWRQKEALAVAMHELIETIVEFDVPHTFLAFPRFTSDSEYTYRKLGFLVPGCTAEDFKQALDARYEPTAVIDQPLTRGERYRILWNAPIGFVRRAIHRVRRPETD